MLPDMPIWHEAWYGSKPVQAFLISVKTFQLRSTKKFLERENLFQSCYE